jgi:hypothetical protein|tara:strand:- start:76 stop:444 length:369 start_codon:yes stop_codon:yes gene_type:complete
MTQIIQTAAKARPTIAIDAPQLERSPSPLADYALAKDICDLLMAHYPGHPWAVNADHDQGVSVIKNTALSRKGGMIMHIGKINGPSDLRDKVVRFGGEFLERYDIPRGEASTQGYAEASKQL